jgi:hypothetical protein
VWEERAAAGRNQGVSFYTNNAPGRGWYYKKVNDEAEFHFLRQTVSSQLRGQCVLGVCMIKYDAFVVPFSLVEVSYKKRNMPDYQQGYQDGEV